MNKMIVTFKIGLNKGGLIFLSLYFSSTIVYSQEWRNLRSYQRITGQSTLQNGCWLKKDRKKDNGTWRTANVFNLSADRGDLKYKSIQEKRDFYDWFDEERVNQGHEINIIGVVAIVADQLSNFDKFFVRTLVIRSKEVVWFGHEGSDKVLAYAFPLLKEVYFSEELLKGEAAKEWDFEFEKNEQCIIVEAVYNQLSAKSIGKLERMAKGKGIYNLAVKKELKFKGEITNCKDRYKYAFTDLMNYYLENK